MSFDLPKKYPTAQEISKKYIVKETYDFHNDTFDIVRSVVEETDKAREEAIITHFKCDMSDFRKWLAEKKKPIITNADRIRSMSDEQLAREIEHIASCEDCPIRESHCDDENGCEWSWLNWLREEAKE